MALMRAVCCVVRRIEKPHEDGVVRAGIVYMGTEMAASSGGGVLRSSVLGGVRDVVEGEGGGEKWGAASASVAG